MRRRWSNSQLRTARMRNRCTERWGKPSGRSIKPKRTGGITNMNSCSTISQVRKTEPSLPYPPVNQGSSLIRGALGPSSHRTSGSWFHGCSEHRTAMAQPLEWNRRERFAHGTSPSPKSCTTTEGLRTPYSPPGLRLVFPRWAVPLEATVSVQ